MARQANVVLLALPSKTTHILQPLDRTVFSSLAAQHQAINADARLRWPEHNLTLKHFVPIFTEAFHNSVTPANILASYRITGVSPINRQAISSSLMTPSEVFTTPAPASPPWMDEEMKLHERRLEDGYDVRDDKYEAWKSWRTIEAKSSSETSAVLPLGRSLVEVGTISESTAALLQTPIIVLRRLPSSASQARSLTSDEFFYKLQEIEKEKEQRAEAKEANKRQREKRKAEKAARQASVLDTPLGTTPPLGVCAICHDMCNALQAFPACDIVIHPECSVAVSCTDETLCPNCMYDMSR